jgi:hypothetical protein
MAEDERESMQAVLDRAIERYRREKFLRGANADFAALKTDAKAWKQELRDRDRWETTVPDGVSSEEHGAKRNTAQNGARPAAHSKTTGSRARLKHPLDDNRTGGARASS